MSLEISPMHHPVVVGRNAEQLKVIMKGTNTQIMFPDADDPNIPVLRKSCVTITGQIKDVYTARQQLVVSSLQSFFVMSFSMGYLFYGSDFFLFNESLNKFEN